MRYSRGLKLNHYDKSIAESRVTDYDYTTADGTLQFRREARKLFRRSNSDIYYFRMREDHPFFNEPMIFDSSLLAIFYTIYASQHKKDFFYKIVHATEAYVFKQITDYKKI